MRQRETLAIRLPVGPNYLAPLSEFVVTAKVLVKPRLREVNFYDWVGWNPLNYKRDNATKRFLVRCAKPTDVEVVLERDLIEKGFEIVWEVQ